MVVLSCVRLLATPWTVAHQDPLSLGCSRQEYWSGWPLPSPGDLLDPGIEPASPVLAGRFFTTELLETPKSLCTLSTYTRLPCGSDSKESTCNERDLGWIPGLGRSPGGGHSNPLQYSCLRIPMDRGAWWATVHGVTKIWA